MASAAGLIADAVLRYERDVDAGVRLATVLIEVDRGTYPVARLARKIAEYAAWWRTPHRHTHRADRLIIVVDLPTAAAEDRIVMLCALLRQEPATASTTLPIAGVALPALIAAGPWAPALVDALDATQTPVGLSHVGR